MRGIAMRQASACAPKTDASLRRAERGAQLLELALTLPLLAVLTVGIIEFAQAFILKQKLTNAAREGARIAVQQQTSDITQTPYPETMDIIRNSVANYLEESDVDMSSMDATPTKTGPAEWTYYGGGNEMIVIDRAVDLNPGAAFTVGTRVTVRYPYEWTFDGVIQFMLPSASYPGSFLISADSLMRQLT